MENYSSGNAEFLRGNYQAALKHYLISAQYRVTPTLAANISITLRALRNFDKALEVCLFAIKEFGEYNLILNSLGLILVDLKRPFHALLIFKKIRSSNNTADTSKFLNNLSIAYLDTQDLSMAESGFRKALLIDYENKDAKINLALVLLQKKLYVEGLELYESRNPLSTQSCIIDAINKIKEGSSVSILVHYEQGIGDTLHYVRFLNALKCFSPKITFLCQRSLLRLVRKILPHLHCVTDASGLYFSHKIPLLSLPFILYRLGLCIPLHSSAPYVQTDFGSRVRTCRQGNVHQKQLLRVGIAWSGNPKFRGDRFRSIDLGIFLTMLPSNSKIRYFVLQMPISTDDLTLLRRRNDIHVRLGDNYDFFDTFSSVKALDLVITVDTAIVHLSGIAGVKTLCILPYRRDWRWGDYHSKKTIYSSVRLLGKQSPDNWAHTHKLVSRYLEYLTKL